MLLKHLPHFVFGLITLGGASFSIAVAPDAPATQPATQPTTQSAKQATTRPSQEAVVLPGSRVALDLPYVKNPAAKQKLDIYAPADAKNASVVVFVHGGEWARHDKSEVSFKPRFFNSNGVIFVSTNYRLSDTDQHPAQVNDVAAAVRWVKDHIADYGGDPHSIFLMGHSAGCHIVTLVGLDPRPLETVGLKPSDLRGVISWSGGAFDLKAKVEENGMYAGYIRKNFGELETTWKDASPILHINDVPDHPNFLFASASGDRESSRAMSEKMVKAINQSGGHAARVILDGRDHFYANHLLGEESDSTGMLFMQFMKETMENEAK